MNRRSVLAVFALAGLTAMLANAADKPNFSGSWKMNPAKSDFGPIPPPEKLERTIKHEDPKMTVNTLNVGPQGEIKSESIYTTDGKDSVNKNGGMEVKSVAAWDGDKLTIKYKREVQGMEISFVETWTLAADGKILTVVNDLSTPQGDFKLTTVMDKQ
jgi:hypothetical protein